MHTYRKADGGGWKVIFDAGETYDVGETFVQTGPTFNVECEAAAFASFLNGGRYSPGEIAHIFAVPVVEEADDSIHPARPDFDYQIERKRK